MMNIKQETLKYNVISLILFRIIIVLGAVFLFTGVVKYVLFYAEGMSMISGEYEQHMAQNIGLLKFYILFGIFLMIIGVLVSLIIERQRFKSENATKSLKSSFLKDVLSRYATLVIASFVFYIPFCVILVSLPEDYIDINPILYGCLLSIMAIILFKEIDSKNN